MDVLASLDLGTLHAALDADPDRVYVLNAEGRYAFFNRTAREAVPERGWELLIGRQPSEGLPPDLAAPLDRMLKRTLGGQASREQRELRTPAGPPRLFDTTTVPLFDGSVVVGAVMRARDITAEELARERLRHELALQAAVASIARAAATEVASADIYRLAAEAAFGLAGAGAVSVVRRSRDQMVVLATAGQSSPTARDRRPVAESPVFRAVRAARRLVVMTVPRRARIRPDLSVVIGAPIRSGGRIWGALVVAPEGGRDPDDALLGSLGQLADVLGLALDAASARRRLASLASTDPLTGLANARSVREGVAVAIAQARRHGRDLVLAQIDLDRFKLVNDVHGHAAGDAVLRSVGAALRETSRAGDVIGRLGGEEFVWLMVETTILDAVAVADRFRARIAGIGPKGGATVTASVGLAPLGPDDDARSLLAGADLAVYQAKADGRDLTRVCAVSGGELDHATRSVLVEHDRIVEGLRALARRRAGDPTLPSRLAAAVTVEATRHGGWNERDLRRLRDAAALIGVEPDLAVAALDSEQVAWLAGEGDGGTLLAAARSSLADGA